MFVDYFWHHHVLMLIQTVQLVFSEDSVSNVNFFELMLYQMQLNLVLQDCCLIHCRQIQILMCIVIGLDVSHRSRNDDSVICWFFFLFKKINEILSKKKIELRNFYKTNKKALSFGYLNNLCFLLFHVVIHKFQIRL